MVGISYAMVSALSFGTLPAYACYCDGDKALKDKSSNLKSYPGLSWQTSQLIAQTPAWEGSSPLQGGTASTTLQGGTQSTTLQGGTQSTTLQGGTQSTTLQGGTQGTLIQGNIERQGGPINILFLLDASRSMAEKLQGKDQKMDSAKMVLQQALGKIPRDIRIGLRVFGQSAGNAFDDCQQSALLVPPKEGSNRKIVESLRFVRPFGMTPLTYGLLNAERDMRDLDGVRQIILISDGAETCGGDPCDLIRRLRARGINIKIDIVGLGLKGDKEAREQLNCIAEASGGKFFDTNSVAELIEQMSHTVEKAISGRVITKMRPSSGQTGSEYAGSEVDSTETIKVGPDGTPLKGPRQKTNDLAPLRELLSK
jgi:Mg-chelatase subunit ChlD